MGFKSKGFQSRADNSRERARRTALKALKRAKKAAERTGIPLSEWEGEFLGSVEQRVEQYGRAFRDPEKGPAGASLSALQAVKLKEIGAKTSGKEKAPRWRRNSPAKRSAP